MVRFISEFESEACILVWLSLGHPASLSHTSVILENWYHELLKSGVVIQLKACSHLRFAKQYYWKHTKAVPKRSQAIRVIQEAEAHAQLRLEAVKE